MSFSEEKRKKLIVPAVALMMCAVAMIGVGYALTSSVQNTDNVVNNDSFVVELYKKNGDENLIGTGGFSGTGVKVDYYTKQINSDIKYYLDKNEKEIGRGYLKISTDNEDYKNAKVYLNYSISVDGINNGSFSYVLNDGSHDLSANHEVQITGGVADLNLILKIKGTDSAAADRPNDITYTLMIDVSTTPTS